MEPNPHDPRCVVIAAVVYRLSLLPILAPSSKAGDAGKVGFSESLYRAPNSQASLNQMVLRARWAGLFHTLALAGPGGTLARPWMAPAFGVLSFFSFTTFSFNSFDSSLVVLCTREAFPNPDT